MTWMEAKEDGVRIGKENGFTCYYPPCHVCGAPVYSWSYVRGATYTCGGCREKSDRLKNFFERKRQSPVKSSKVQLPNA